MRENKYLSFARYVLTACLVVTGVGLVLYFVWYAADLLMIVFAGVLVSIMLRGISRFVGRKTGISQNFSLALVSLVLLCLLGIAGWLVAERIGAQIAEIGRVLPQAFENVRISLTQYKWGQEIISIIPNLTEWLSARSSTIISRVTGMASTAFGGIINFIIVIIIGLYLASQPELYSRGIKHLLPFRYRDRAGEILHTLDEALWRWLGGRFLLMIINGTLTGIGLLLLGMPLSLTLGLLAGLLNFIPNFGPWIAAVPAVLIAFLQSPTQALYVAVLYLVLQSVDAYVLTPLIDRKSVELPPVVTITAQIFLGIAFGLLGLSLASPLTAVLMILIKPLYVEEILDDPVMEKSQSEDKTQLKQSN